MQNEDIQEITQSSLFDAQWYRIQYNVYHNQAKDYLDVGWKLGRNPSPLFHGDVYLKMYPDVAASNMNPLLHYERFGKQEGRLCRLENSILTSIGATSLRSDVDAIDLETIIRSPLFDADWYKKHYNIWGSQAADYLRDGWKLGRNPSAMFRTDDYLHMYPDIAATGMNPLLHYERYGKYEGRAYSPDNRSPVAYIPEPQYVGHGKWQEYLSALCNKEGYKVLEIGSRLVVGQCKRDLFDRASYTGFDLYPGENVDVVGDAHKLSSFFAEESFDLLFTSAVFEHLAMPWVVANEMIRLLKPGGYVFVETHYCYGAHELPWHFFQFGPSALKVLFPEQHGISCLDAGVSSPMVGRFAAGAIEELRGKYIDGLYCHSEFLGQKTGSQSTDWNELDINKLVDNTHYPRPKKSKQ